MDATTRLIEEPDDPQSLTPYRDCDCRTALARGLSDYLLQLSIDTIEGRHLQLNAALDTTADTEQDATYPAVEVYLPTEGMYDATGFTPGISEANALAPGLYMQQPGEFTADLRVEVWSTEPEDRVALQIMLEDGLQPVHWMSGFRLELPHYFNARADYLLLRAVFDESEDKAGQRYRIAVLTVHATLPWLRVVKLPLARPKTQLVVTEDPLAKPQAVVGKVVIEPGG